MAEESNNFFKLFALEFNQTFFYSYFLQIILVSYMYNTVGHGRYWKVLFYGSVLGFFGALMEHVFVAYQQLLPEEEKHTTNVSILLLLAEIGWICTEFSVPVLNIIKLNSLTNVKLVKAVNIATIIFFLGFVFTRCEIGYFRFSEHRVDCLKCNQYHSQAFGIMAVTDIMLSIMIFLRLNKSSREYKMKKNNENISILHTFKKSSVFSLLIVDVISVFLSLTYVFNSTKDYAQPFHALKSNFLLVLAVDAFIFKFKANSGNGSTYRSYNETQSANTQSLNGTASYFKAQKTMVNTNTTKPTNATNMTASTTIKVNSNGSINNSNLSNYNLSSSQPITVNGNKPFGLFNSKETQINIESPKPAASANNDKYNNNAYMYHSSSNTSLPYDKFSDGSLTNLHDYANGSTTYTLNSRNNSTFTNNGLNKSRSQTMNINAIYAKNNNY